MTNNNFLEKSFGPVASSAGLIIFSVGLITTYTSLYGLILVFFGVFIGFTSTSTIIDFDTKRVRFSNNIFGIIKTGKWTTIEPTMKIGIKNNNVVWTSYSRSNRAMEINNNDFFVVLCDSEEKEIMPLKKAKSLDAAKLDLEILGNQLRLTMI
jgi:hypothetical protein